MFARKTDDGLASFAKHLETMVTENAAKKAKATVVLTVAGKDAVAAKLVEIAKEKGLSKVPLTVAADGEAGPEKYSLAKDVPITVVVYDGTKAVTATFAFDTLDSKAQAQALAAFAKVLGVEAPKVDDSKAKDDKSERRDEKDAKDAKSDKKDEKSGK